MSLTYNDISALVDAGNSAAEIATALGQDTRHVRDCWATKQDADANSPDLLFMLTARYDVLSLDKSAAWTGSLIDAIEATGNAALIAGFNKLLTQLQITGRKVLANSDTTGLTGYLVTAIAGIVGQLVEARGQGTTAAEVVQDVYTLTGGPRFAGVDAAAVQAVIDLQAAEDLLESKRTALNDAIAAEQALRDAAAVDHETAITRLQSLKNQDTYALSLAEIEAEIATVRTYPETYPAEGE